MNFRNINPIFPFYDIIYIKVDGGDINKQSFTKTLRKSVLVTKCLISSTKLHIDWCTI